jgi:thiol-disulfide isomerase/thioredoxin
MKRHFVSLALLAFSTTAGLAQAPAKALLPPETDMSHDGWYAEFPPALAQARKTGMDMLIDFGGSDWCAPCKWLKENILTKPGFNREAEQFFVRVDIDALARGLSPQRKARYVALQKQFHVLSFPSVFLTTPEGEPYAWTTYIPVVRDVNSVTSAQLDKPEAFWAQIQPLIARGKIFRANLAKAKPLEGTAKADALIDAFTAVRPDFLLWYYPDRLAELRALDPSDHRGFLAYLDGTNAYGELEDKIGGGFDLNPAVKVTDVDAVITQAHLTGETLQRALAMKAALQVVNGDARAAFESIRGIVDAQARRGPFDRGDYLSITPEGAVKLKQSAAEGLANPNDALTQYRVLHRIFEGHELPDRFEISCHATGGFAFQPVIAVRKPTATAFGNALLASTASLAGEARAEALARGLDGTAFLRLGPIDTIVTKIVPDLVGLEKAQALLPANYRAWIAPR